MITLCFAGATRGSDGLCGYRAGSVGPDAKGWCCRGGCIVGAEGAFGSTVTTIATDHSLRVWSFRQVMSSCIPLLSDTEARVRMAVSECLPWCVAVGDRVDVMHLIDVIRNDIDRRLVENDLDDSAPPDPERAAEMEPDEAGSSGRMAAKSGLQQTTLRHETMGWHSLETSIRSLARLTPCLGLHTDDVLSRDLCEIMCRCSSHLNRFVREVSIEAIAAVSCCRCDGLFSLSGAGRWGPLSSLPRSGLGRQLEPGQIRLYVGREGVF
jgi:hypothetical protein